jgi:CspA family cold shock protein
MPQGTVKWFNQTKGFGFIEIEGGADLFVHISEVTGEISDGDTVQFEVGESDKGPNAIGVSKVE